MIKDVLLERNFFFKIIQLLSTNNAKDLSNLQKYIKQGVFEMYNAVDSQ